MKNFVQDGNVINVVAGAGIASGAIVQSGAFIGVAASTVLTGETVPVNICGVFSVPCLSTDVVAQGDALYFDESESRMTTSTDTGANSLAGYAWSAKANGVTTVEVRLLF
jgi:predicted RecA/RadA family phage recombinase